MGLQLLEREKVVFKENPHAQPDFSGYEYILERQLKPEARMDIIQLLKEKGIKPTAMMDVSDGLSPRYYTSATIPVSVVISTKRKSRLITNFQNGRGT